MTQPQRACRAAIIATALAASSVATDAAWHEINFVDDFGEVTGKGVVSDPVGPVRPMSSPYDDVTARIYVDCYDAWVRFSKAPNLRGGSIQDGYTRYAVTVRIEGDGKTNKPRRWSATQVWGGRDLRFTPAMGAVASLSAGSEFAIALPWYGQDSAVFSWSLRGSAEAIRRGCN